MKREVLFSRVCAALVLGSAVVCCAGDSVNVRPPDALPGVMLWAWHGVHDLHFLNPAEAGVAFLAGTVRVSGQSVALSPGARSIETSRGVVLLPVVRVEIDAARRAVLGRRQLDDVTAAVLGFDDSLYPGLQIDFDATHSQREFYRNLLTNVRRALGGRFLSVAALPSWCLGDPWLPMGLVDEVVPMVYSMGVDSEFVRRLLVDSGDFRTDCRGAIGLSSDEPVVLPGRDRRLYLFSSQPWSRSAYERFARHIVEAETRSEES